MAVAMRRSYSRLLSAPASGHDERSFGSLNETGGATRAEPGDQTWIVPGHARRLVLVSASKRAS